MFIRELARLAGVSTKAIRYYESVGLLPRPTRAANNYRQYSPAAVARLRFINSARALGFSLADIAGFLQAQDDNQLPCRRVLDALDQRIKALDQRIADLQAMRELLDQIRHGGREVRQGKNQPGSNTLDQQCVCHLLSVNGEWRVSMPTSFKEDRCP